MLKLDIGSGFAHGEDGWVGVDPFSSEADVRAFMWDLPYEDNTVDEIFSSHSLEHIGKAQVPVTLREWFRVLKPGGKVTVRVPDLEWCVNHWLNHKYDTGWCIDIIFVNQNHEGEYHKTGFIEYTLKKYLTDVGFRITKFEELNTHSQRTLSAECTK